MRALTANPLSRIGLWKLIALALFVGAVVAVSLAGREALSSEVQCSDFNNQRQAQRFFRRHDPKQDPHNLVDNPHRAACADLRCACSPRWRRHRALTRGTSAREAQTGGSAARAPQGKADP